MTDHVIICNDEAGPSCNARTKYVDFRAAVVKAGKFSVFEATANSYARKLYTMLHDDRTLEVKPVGFPWTTVTEVPGRDANGSPVEE